MAPIKSWTARLLTVICLTSIISNKLLASADSSSTTTLPSPVDTSDKPKKSSSFLGKLAKGITGIFNGMGKEAKTIALASVDSITTRMGKDVKNVLGVLGQGVGSLASLAGGLAQTDLLGYNIDTVKRCMGEASVLSQSEEGLFLPYLILKAHTCPEEFAYSVKSTMTPALGQVTLSIPNYSVDPAAASGNLSLDSGLLENWLKLVKFPNLAQAVANNNNAVQIIGAHSLRVYQR